MAGSRIWKHKVCLISGSVHDEVAHVLIVVCVAEGGELLLPLPSNHYQLVLLRTQQFYLGGQNICKSAKI